MHVTEMIRYTFAGEPHAIIRTIPNLRHVDAGHDQVLGVHDVRVRGADDLKVKTAHDATVLTSGGHDAATSGGGTYVTSDHHLAAPFGRFKRCTQGARRVFPMMS